MAAPTVSYTGQYKMSQSGKNWELRLLTSGTLNLSKTSAVDVFLVGGGGGGGKGNSWIHAGGGGGGGYTRTQNKIRLTKNTTYYVTIGAGGASENPGGTTSAFGLSAAGGRAGESGQERTGGAGGSGGGTGAYIDYNVTYISSGNGGADGSKGGTAYGTGGAGQGSSTRAFGESGGELFSGGGGGGSAATSNYIFGDYFSRVSGMVAPGGSGGGGTGGARKGPGGPGAANTGGGGGGGGCTSQPGGTGGSGIIIVRNTRFGATTLVTAKNGEFGSPIQISLSRDDASALHTVRAVLLNAAGQEIYTETVAQMSAVYPTISWTPSVELYAPLVKNAASAKFQIQCVTYVDGDEQGEEELDYPITVSFPAKDLAPTIANGAVTVSPYNAGAAAGISCFVQGYSMADSSFDDSLITLKYGAGIVKREVICNGVSNAAAPYRTGLLAGETELIARVTDSRGFTAQRKIKITPEYYAKPRLSGISIQRCDSGGTVDEGGGRIKIKASATVSSLAGENSLSLTAAVRSRYGSFGVEESLTSGAENVLTAYASPDETLIVRLTATDRLGETAQYEHTLTHRKWVMKFRENGEGVAFGKAPSADKVLEIPEDWEIKRGQQILSWSGEGGSSGGTGGGGDLPVASGIKMELLWENPDAENEFVQQYITLPEGERDLYMVITKDLAWGFNTDCFIAPNITGMAIKLCSSVPVDTQAYTGYRQVSIESGTSLLVRENIIYDPTGYMSGEYNEFVIPWQIYGIKL